ncbi:GNAT family N-acetyltransferase [Kaistella jeonii]|uniref:Alanine acetyltransferase n=1 Tax=Kaistella jeonii TaxID=266749 RepID=A0A0C1FMB4_9FLAO|nr:GNAT family N-acetyltransferase [Kaistella jeonii]KIA89074.1 alanine acetyltransferase [Kaistella jeonii]SFB94996.1 ribosomal-protein-alanine N-acetyltransferase [Kaistella jeonii]VEI97121.1 Putative ribosomal N-acetyltransferase YdaF [Kaistella jeonii]
MRFSTERLILRPINENDAVEILGIRSNEHINKFLHRVPPQNSFEALEFILNIKRKSANNDIVFLAISVQNNPKLLGTICLWKFSEDRKTAELGYELLPEYHGKGIMSEAVNFILNYGFNDLNLNKIEAFTNKNNLNSIKLLQKSKFVLNENRRDKKFPENLIFELTSI